MENCIPKMANSASDDDFRLRCRSALTHPVTAAALCLLVVNDWLLKPVSPNPWTTGKISDFAWVVFASPALAFALAAGAGAVGGAAAYGEVARRAVWSVAYIGLPMLYAAFNTFQPVNEAALFAMSLIGGGAGSPMDPADSLVIPIGAAVAVWTWRRPPARAESLRVRLGLVAALIAALASVASTHAFNSQTYGDNWHIGKLEDGALFISSRYRSDDGGLTWTIMDEPPDHDSVVEWGYQKGITTPRGLYIYEEGSSIFRETEGGERELAYPAEYLSDDANKLFQQFLGGGVTIVRPVGLIYDERSGNVIVSMGTQGAVVVEPNGDWRRVSVGPHVPIDFSLINKTRAALLEWTIWLPGLAFAVSAIAAVLVFIRICERISTAETAIAILISLAFPFSLLFVGERTPPEWGIWWWPFALVAVGAALSLRWRAARMVTGLVCWIYSALISTFAALLVWIAEPWDADGAPTYIAGIVLGIVAILMSRPPRRDLPAVLGALAAALPLTALGVAFGAVAGFRFDFSKPVFLAFAIILALALARILNRRNSPTER